MDLILPWPNSSEVRNESWLAKTWLNHMPPPPPWFPESKSGKIKQKQHMSALGTHPKDQHRADPYWFCFCYCCCFLILKQTHASFLLKSLELESSPRAIVIGLPLTLWDVCFPREASPKEKWGSMCIPPLSHRSSGSAWGDSGSLLGNSYFSDTGRCLFSSLQIVHISS